MEAIVLEISHQHPKLRPGARIGVWCATKLATDAGGWRQINRGGYPMMWPIFRSEDTHFSDPANTGTRPRTSPPKAGISREQVAAVVAANGTADDPQGYGEIVARELFPDILPYEVGTPAGFSFAAINGRPIADDAPGVMMSMVPTWPCPLGSSRQFPRTNETTSSHTSCQPDHVRAFLSGKTPVLLSRP